MQLTLWTYEGPPHVGAMRIATAMEDVHYVLHAPQGDTYADLLFTMIERLQKRPPVTYTTFQARDLGGDTAELFKTAAREAYERFQPKAMLVGSSCTAELIQDDPGGLAHALKLDIPVIPLELPSYQRKENWGASETFYQLVRNLALPADQIEKTPSSKPRCNILGPAALGFRHRDDLTEIRKLLTDMGIEPFLLSASLLGVLAQRLVRKLCVSCPGATCPQCAHTGYQGRTGIFELLVTDSRMRVLIHNTAGEAALREAAMQCGMRSLRDDGQRLVQQGITSAQELLRVTRD